MIYNNLIYFLVVIFVFSTSIAPEAPLLAPSLGMPLFLLMLFSFYRLAGKWYGQALQGGSKKYFAAEKKLSILAVFLFTGSVFIFDLKYYLTPFSFNDAFPVLENLAGLSLFFFFLALMWLQARPAYEILFQRAYTPVGFVLSNIKANLPIVLPWLALSLLFDLLSTLPFPRLQELLTSPWGDLILFLVFVLFLGLFFPPLVRWLWNCKPMEPGPLRTEMEIFFRKQNFSAEILYWPLFEGRILTAAVMGIVPGFRYLLVTPALLSVLDREELESVLAHEIGHVKNGHLLLYILLFFGFSMIAGALVELVPYLILGSEWFYWLAARLPVTPDGLLAFLSALFFLILMLLYFRFLFGYFLRNFERQADLYVFKALGTSIPLIRSFEKIASLSGNIRDQKSWHHFGIGERVDFLEKCERNRETVRRHDHKVYTSLAVYFVLVAFVTQSIHGMDKNALAHGYETRYMQAVLEQKLKKEPENSLWLQLLGDLMQQNKMEEKAIEAYEEALRLSPMKADLANNLAWVLLTAKDRSLRDPRRALTLARSAAMLKENGYILDTLALALWANGFVEEAVEAEIKAARRDPEHWRYYRVQAEKFQTSTWEDS